MFPVVPNPQDQGFHVPDSAATKHGHATLTGTVRKVIASLDDQAELVEIVLEGAEPLYCEIRIRNTLRTSQDQIISLKLGDRVTLSVESS